MVMATVTATGTAMAKAVTKPWTLLVGGREITSASIMMTDNNDDNNWCR